MWQLYRESLLRLNPAFALSNVTTEETLRQSNSCVPALLSDSPKCSPSMRLHAGDWADDPIVQQQEGLRVVFGEGCKRQDEMKRKILKRGFQRLRIALNLI